MMGKNLKKFTLLHSNDMHGDFLAEAKGAEGKLIGGLALLSGYLNKVRHEEKNVLYAIAGDMVQGSTIDLEYKGISTIELMNYLAPDVATLGNHEFEYGLLHLLFLERLANFPIVNANLYIKKYPKRLMRPYLILNVDGFDIMFIGIITDEVLSALKKESDVGSFISLEEASIEVGRICNAYKGQDIDLTVLLTHIGFEADKQLAAMLDPAWGVDLIIGGHSHTVLEQPAKVNNILIAQAGVGTDQIGRFDLLVDDDTNSIVQWDWHLVPIEEGIAEPDKELQKFIDTFKEAVDRKYNTPLCRFAQELTHPTLYEETALGNLFADILAQRAETDFVLLASFAIRGTEMGPLVTLGDFHARIPYDDALFQITLTGADLKQIFRHFMRLENRAGVGYFFQVNRSIRAIYDDTQQELDSLTCHGQLVADEQPYTVCVQSYHYEDTVKHFGLPQERFTALAPLRTVATSMQDVFEEYLRTHPSLNSTIEGRLRFKY